MFKHKKSNYINKVIKNWIYCLIFFSAIAFVFIAHPHPANSQAISSSKENLEGDKFLVEKYNIALIPAFNLTDTNYQFKSQKQVLAMGTSEFDELPSLPGIMVELETIVPKVIVINQSLSDQKESKQP